MQHLYRNKISISADFSSETMQRRRDWNEYLKYWKRKITNLKFFTQSNYPQKEKEK